jgi:hypothetical protein
MEKQQSNQRRFVREAGSRFTSGSHFDVSRISIRRTESGLLPALLVQRPLLDLNPKILQTRCRSTLASTPRFRAP